MFARGVQPLAQRAMSRQRPELTWDETSLTFRLGSHTLVKRLVDGEFQTRCDCDWSKDEHCLHEYMAFSLLHQICIRERWRYPGDSPFLISLKREETEAGDSPQTTEDLFTLVGLVGLEPMFSMLNRRDSTL